MFDRMQITKIILFIFGGIVMFCLLGAILDEIRETNYWLSVIYLNQ